LVLIITKPVDETKAELVLPDGKVKSNSILVTYKPRANIHGTGSRQPILTAPNRGFRVVINSK
jgi:hypothetical protein